MFSSERQNVIKACDIVRHSPLIGPKIPVHGLLLDIETGRLDWVVNGYQTLEMAGSQLREPAGPIGQAMQALGNFNIGEMKFPETRIGEFATKAEDWLSKEAGQLEAGAAETMRNVAPVAESVQTDRRAGCRVRREKLAASSGVGATRRPHRRRFRCRRQCVQKSFNRETNGETGIGGAQLSRPGV